MGVQQIDTGKADKTINTNNVWDRIVALETELTGIPNDIGQQLESHTTQLAEIANKRLQFVSYEMFGAKLDGVDDDTQAVVDAHNFANANNVKVVQNRGTLYLKTASNIIVKTSLDLSGCDIKITESMANRNIYSISSDYLEETVTITAPLKSELIENATTVPSLASRKFSIYKVTCSDPFANRSNGEVYTKSESFVSLTNGVLADGGLIFDYTNAANLLIKARSVQDKPIKIVCGNVRINTTDVNQMAKLFYISRSNVDLSNVNVFIDSMPLNTNTTTTVYKGNIIQVDFAYNVHIHDFSGEGITAENTNGTSIQQSGGILSVNYASYVYIDRMHMLRGHGTIGSGWVKKIFVSNSLLNRIDCHYVHRDFSVDNVTFVGNNNGLVIGWGKGTWNVRNLSFQYANTSNYNSASAIFLRTDIGAIFDGNIVIDGLEMNVIENITSCNIFQGYLVDDYAFNATVPHRMPKVSMNNVRVNTKYNTRVYGMSLQINGSYYDTHPVQLSEFNLSNVTFTRVDAGARFQTIFAKFYNNGVSGTLKANVKDFDLGLSLANAGQNLIEVIDMRTTITDTLDISLRNTQFELKLDKAKATNVYAERCKVRLNVTNSGRVNTLELQSCETNSMVGMDNIVMYNSSASFLDNAVITAKVKNSTVSGYLTSTGSTTYAEFDNCVITPAVQSSQSTLKLTNCTLRNCLIKQNASNPIIVTSVNNKCLFLGNIIEGTVVNASDVNLLFKNLPTGYLQPTN